MTYAIWISHVHCMVFVGKDREQLRDFHKVATTPDQFMALKKTVEIANQHNYLAMLLITKTDVVQLVMNETS